MIDRPGQWPDTRIFPHDIPKTFAVTFTDENGEIDLSESTVTVVVEDNTIEVGSLGVDMTDSATGIVWLTVDQDVFDAVGNYSTWRLRETSYFEGELVLQGRLVKDGG